MTGSWGLISKGKMVISLKFFFYSEMVLQVGLVSSTYAPRKDTSVHPQLLQQLKGPRGGVGSSRSCAWQALMRLQVLVPSFWTT